MAKAKTVYDSMVEDLVKNLILSKSLPTLAKTPLKAIVLYDLIKNLHFDSVLNERVDLQIL